MTSATWSCTTGGQRGPTGNPPDAALDTLPDAPADAAPDTLPDVPPAPADATPIVDGDSAVPDTPRDHHRCAWIYTNEPDITAVFVAHAAWYDAIHPVWYAMNSDGVSVRTIAGVDDPSLLAAARANHVAVIPLVASVESTDWLRTMLYDPAKRAAHIKTLVDLAVARGYDGLDLDYEHLWNAADRAPLAAFITEFATAMHAAGKSASMATPAPDQPSSVWDYALVGTQLDRVHLMGYDFHTVGSPHAGPTAPLGWIDRVGAYVASLGHPEKFLLGLPNYGITTTSFCTLATCAATCTSPVATTTDHMQSCSLANYPMDAGRAPHCDTAAGTLYFDDTASLEEKVQSAKAHGLGGVTYWNVSGEPDGFFDMVQRYY